MKLFACSDFHGARIIMDKLPQAAEMADMVLLCGDICGRKFGQPTENLPAFQRENIDYVCGLLDAAGKPYSKRDGDAFVGDFREKGFLPQALFNYLALLGWSPGDDREKMSREELIEAFTIERALCSPAQFDIKKLTNMNGAYIAEMDPADFRAQIAPFVAKLCPEGVGSPILDKVADLMHSRTKTFADVAHWNYFFRKADALEYDSKGLKKLLSDDTVRKAVAEFGEKVKTLPALTVPAIDDLIHSIEAEHGIQQDKLKQPLRIASTGSTIGAGICETIELLGAEESAVRIARALSL